MRVALWHAHCADDEVVRMRGLIMRRRCIDAAADAQVLRWERACMRMLAGLVQGSEGAPEEASLCMVLQGAFDPRSGSAAACVEKLFLWNPENSKHKNMYFRIAFGEVTVQINHLN
jgi:hypothetical protein